MPEDATTIERRPTVVAPAETPGLTGLLTLAVAVVVVAGLYLGRTVLIPITLAVLLSFLLAPIVNLLRRIHFGRVLSVLVAVMLALGVIVALGGLIGTQLAELAQEVPKYASTIREKVDTVQGFAISEMSLVMRRLDTPPPRQAPPQRPKPAPSAEPKPVQVEVHQPDPTPMQLAERIITPIVDPLSTTVIVLIVTIFVLLQREDLRDRLIRLFGSSDLHRTTTAMNDAARRLSRYFLIQLGINTTFGVIIGIGLFVIGVPSPLLWGTVGLLLRFVPYIGAPLAAVLPLALAAAVSPDWSMMLWTAGLYAAHRGDHGPGGGAAAVWPQHRPVAVLRRRFRDVLDLAMGPDRPDPVDASHLVPPRARPPRRTARVPGCHPRRPPCLDPGGKLLPADARRRPRRGARPGRGPAA